MDPGEVVGREASGPTSRARTAVAGLLVAAVVALLAWFVLSADAGDDGATADEPAPSEDNADPPDNEPPGPPDIDGTGGADATSESTPTPRALGEPIIEVMDGLELGPGRLAIRSDLELQIYNLETGELVESHELSRNVGGAVWFGNDEVLMRSQGRDGPGMSVLELSTGRFRIYGGLNFIVVNASRSVVLGQEFDRFFGGGRWAQVAMDGFALERLEIPVAPAYPFPIVTEVGVVGSMGGQVVLFGDDGQQVLASGDIVAWSGDSILVAGCDVGLSCGLTSVAMDGRVLAQGPTLDLPPLSLGGDARWLSPDGQLLAVINPSTRLLQFFEVATGREFVHDVGRTPSQSVVWSPDSRYLIVADETAVAFIDVRAQQTTRAEVGYEIDQVGLFDVRPTPDS